MFLLLKKFIPSSSIILENTEEFTKRYSYKMVFWGYAVYSRRSIVKKCDFIKFAFHIWLNLHFSVVLFCDFVTYFWSIYFFYYYYYYYYYYFWEMLLWKTCHCCFFYMYYRGTIIQAGMACKKILLEMSIKFDIPFLRNEDSPSCAIFLLHNNTAQKK